MTIQDFIENKVNELISSLDYVEVFYEYKESSETHFIKVIPKKIFDSRIFANMRADITKDFMENKFPGLICFISEDSRVVLSGPTKIFSSFDNSLIRRPVWNREIGRTKMLCTNFDDSLFHHINSKAA